MPKTKIVQKNTFMRVSEAKGSNNLRKLKGRNEMQKKK